MKKFTFIEHTADIKYQASGRTIQEAFKNAALALTQVISHDKIKQKKELTVKVKGNDFENLLYNFLEELVFLFDTKHFILSKVKSLTINKKKELEATLLGDKASNYELHSAVKAVTYHDMLVQRKKEEWMVQVVLDI